MKYIRRYETNNEFENDYYGDTYAEPWVSYTMENEKVNYNKSIYDMPLTFTFKQSGVLTVTMPLPGPK